MLQVRFNLLTADPLRLGDAIKYVEAEVSDFETQEKIDASKFDKP